MTKAITDRPLKKRGKPPKEAPPTAAETIYTCAAGGFSQVGIAHALATSADTLRRWMDEEPALKEAWERGRETERHMLHNKLYRLAMEQDHASAAMFLLKARHGYREGDQGDQGNRVNITFNLPGAMTFDEFASAAPIDVTPTPGGSPALSLQRK